MGVLYNYWLCSSSGASTTFLHTWTRAFTSNFWTPWHGCFNTSLHDCLTCSAVLTDNSMIWKHFLIGATFSPHSSLSSTRIFCSRVITSVTPFALASLHLCFEATFPGKRIQYLIKKRKVGSSL